MRTRTLSSCAVLLALAALVSADEMPVGAERQGEIFGRVFHFDRTLSESDVIELLVVYDGAPTGLVGDVLSSFQRAGIVASTSSVADLSARIDDASVVYFLPGVDVASLSRLCADKQVLTISGLPALAEQGRVAVGVDLRNDRPEVVVHLGRLKAEGHELSSELLRLSRVIR